MKTKSDGLIEDVTEYRNLSEIKRIVVAYGRSFLGEKQYNQALWFLDEKQHTGAKIILDKLMKRIRIFLGSEKGKKNE